MATPLAYRNTLYMSARDGLMLCSSNSSTSSSSSSCSEPAFELTTRVRVRNANNGNSMGSACSASATAYDPSVLSLAHYEIHRVVGQGGFGKVNAVIRKRTTPPQWFALKTLSKAVVVERKCTTMIWNERNLLASIASPHVVAMHHAFQDDANCYVVMDLLLGGDLKFHLTSKHKNGFQEDHARFYIAGLLLALRYLHSKHILHRDIKPENVILDNEGYPRLTDLGISVSSDTLRYNGNSGTTNYMAPELFYGSREHGIAADFYSLGVMACEILFGKKLWSGSVESRIQENTDLLEKLPVERENEFFPSELHESSTSSPVSKNGRAFLRGLLCPAESGRLGFTDGAEEVMRHAWFHGFDWASFEKRTLSAPFKPTIDANQANCNTAAQDFDDVLEQDSGPQGAKLTPEQQQAFTDFEFNVVISTTPKS